ncbi:MAG: MORN motif-containing protein, partial [Flavobacteriales bacterium]|nr:MORN motif-containing protein [Flavobacteriales bacterium]
GEKYVGEWKDGKSHGEGVYTLSDGRIIEGLFEDGQYKNILLDEDNDDGTTIDFDNGEKYIKE